MKEIVFEQKNPSMGFLQGVCRIDGKFIYLKFNNSEQAQQMISQLRTKGADIVLSKSWIKADIIRDNEKVTIGEETFNPQKLSFREVENKLFEFFKAQWEKAKFKVKVKEW